jgi:hypothetical protein
VNIFSSQTSLVCERVPLKTIILGCGSLDSDFASFDVVFRLVQHLDMICIYLYIYIYIVD